MKTRRISLDQKAYDFIKAKIINAEFLPGQPLRETVLSRMLKISRTPIREAFKALSKENLIVTVKGKGAFISSLTMTGFVEAYHARIALESYAANLSTNNVDLIGLEKFEKIFIEARDQWKENRDGGDLDHLLKTGRKFHFFIITSAENEIMYQLIKNLYDRIDIGRRVATSRSPSRRIQAMDEHVRIIRALKERNGIHAERYMREHLSNALESLMRSF